jgi:hypothetical protein
MRRETIRIAVAASVLAAVGISVPTSGRAEPNTYMQPEIDLAAYYARNLGLDGVGSPRLDSAQARTEKRATGHVVEATPPPDPGGPGRILLALADVPQVSSSTLATMRGGFELPNGLTVNFGFDIATSLANQTDGLPVVQSLNIQGTASGSTISGTIITQNQGGTTTVPLTVGSLPISLLTTANSGQTSVLTSIGSGGLITVISNNAANQLVQHVQTLNVDISGMTRMLSQQAQQSIISRSLNAGTMFGKR